MIFTVTARSRVKRSSQNLRLFQSKVQQTRNMTHTIVPLFITTMSPFDYNAAEKCEKWLVKTKLWENRLLPKEGQHLNSTDSTSSGKRAPGDKCMNDVP